MLKGCGAILAVKFHPMAGDSLADAQCRGDLALRPTLLLQAPGLEPPSFFPVVR